MDEPSDPRENAREMWRGDAASRALGMELLDLDLGRATVAMTVRPDMVNGHRLTHGGLVATLADSAFALACNSRGRVTVAAGFEISFLEAGRLGDRLVATARETALRGRSGIYDVTVVREPGADEGDPVVVAEFRGRSRSIAASRPAPSEEPTDAPTDAPTATRQEP